jgi:uncharacterized repeat protein (TIGR01451 family)
MISRGKRRAGVVMLATAAATIGLLPIATAAMADEPHGVYPEWSVSGHTGTVSVADQEFPVGSIDSDSTSLTTPSGSNTFLNMDTPFGRVFDSSRGHGYLNFRTSAGNNPSTTAITFDEPTPVDRWGFTLGDIDADQAHITATGANKQPLPTADLGWEGAFNYCQGSPLPPACHGKTSTDLPTWHENTSTLVGNVIDTDGASGWFVPTKPVHKLTIVYSKLAGLPIGQLWIAIKPLSGAAATNSDIHVVKTASPDVVIPGGRITYRVVVTNRGTVTEPDAEFRDDLSDVLDNARYEHDAHATSGDVSYDRPVLEWHGELGPGDSATITYKVRVDDPILGNGVIRNAVIGGGPDMTCAHGKGHGCVAVVQVPVFCRARVGSAAGAVSC